MKYREIGKAVMHMVLITIFAASSFSQESNDNKGDFPSISGAYLGQKPPSSAPELLAPGILPTDGIKHCFPAFSTDGKEVFWMSVDMSGEIPKGRILFMEEREGRWTSPEIAPFSGEYNDHAPIFSHDGRRLYFASSRPGGNDGGKNLWYVEKTDSGWSGPIHAGYPPNFEDSGLSQPTFTKDGTVYFIGSMEGMTWNVGIYRSKFVEGKYLPPEPLPEPVNVKGYIADYPCIAPDESFLIFGSNRPGVKSSETDLYISFRNPDDSWTEPVHLGEEINNGRTVCFSNITPDGKYFIFSRFGEGEAGDLFYWADIGILDKYLKK